MIAGTAVLIIGSGITNSTTNAINGNITPAFPSFTRMTDSGSKIESSKKETSNAKRRLLRQQKRKQNHHQQKQHQQHQQHPLVAELSSSKADSPMEEENISRTSRVLTFSDFVSSVKDIFKNANDDEIDEDADADDYYKTMPVVDQYKNNSGSNSNSEDPEGTPWYALSHYIPPNTVLYDTIEGFFISVLFCLIVATCYTHLYYCCFVRCGLCPDDRIYTSLLHREGRKKKRKVIISRRMRMRLRRKRQMDIHKNSNGSCFSSICCCFRNTFCCCCCCCTGEGDDYGHDGRGYFVPLSTTKTADETMPTSEGGDGDNNDDSDGDDEDNNSFNSEDSSLSQDSALSLEYGDDHLADEYGEVTDRLTDSKVEVAAKTFFDHEQKISELESKKQKELLRRQRRMRRNRGCGSIASRRSRRSRGLSAAKSQASSILSSESESLSSFHSSSSSDEDDDNHSLEMESAMMELELTGRRVNDAQMGNIVE